jgi:hypothetical protein
MNTIAGKIQRSWELFKRSVGVIREHPKLLVFPVVTGVLTTVIALFFLAPVVLVVGAPHWVAGSTIQKLADAIGFVRFGSGGNFNFQVQPVGTAILAFMYLLNLFLATMASVGFNHQILAALNGQPVSVSAGIGAACARWKAVLLWSLLAGVVGLLIRALEERVSFVGRIVAGLIGLAWSMASIFVIPILAREPTLANPFKVLSRSAETIKRTWGETLTGYAGMQGMNILVLCASLLLWVVAIMAAGFLGNAWLLLAFGLPWLAALIAYSYLASVASRVYLCALYVYAADGVVPSQFDSEMMHSGWKIKKAMRRG